MFYCPEVLQHRIWYGGGEVAWGILGGFWGDLGVNGPYGRCCGAAAPCRSPPARRRDWLRELVGPAPPLGSAPRCSLQLGLARACGVQERNGENGVGMAGYGVLGGFVGIWALMWVPKGFFGVCFFFPPERRQRRS